MIIKVKRVENLENMLNGQEVAAYAYLNQKTHCKNDC